MKMVSKLPSATELKRLGISLYDKNGKAKTVKQLMEELARIKK